MKIEWRDMDSVPEGDRIFLLLREGEKGNGELAVGMVFMGSYGEIDCYWTWGGPNSGSDISERPIRWAPLPENWRDPLPGYQKTA